MYTAFVKWDDEKYCGRYFECYYSGGSGTKLHCTCHDGDKGVRENYDVIPIRPYDVESYDYDCIAYWDDRGYAFRGHVEAVGDDTYFVRFADGDAKHVVKDKVYSFRSVFYESL